MVYWLLKPFLSLLYRAYFKRIFINGGHNFLKNKPFFLTANHSNAFVDAIIPAGSFRRSLNFLTRGDVFKGGLITWALESTHQVPIYRQRDGKDSMKKNEKTFSIVNEMLGDGKAIMVFPEADCFPIKRLRPLKKGTAKMAFSAMEAHNWEIDLYIIPLGLNYVAHTEIRSEVMVNFNKPIRIKDYQAEFEKNESKAVVQLTQDVEAKLSEMLIIVDKEIEDETEQLLNIYRNGLHYSRTKWLRKETDRMVEEKLIAKNLSNLFHHQKNKFDEKKKHLKIYSAELEKHSVSDFGIAKINQGITISFLHFLFFPIGFIGYLLNKPIFNFADKKAKQLSKKPEFISSLRLGFILFLYLIPSLFILIAISVLFGILVGVLSVTGLFLFSLFAVHNRDAIKESKLMAKAKRLKKQDPNSFQGLVKARTELLKF